MLEGLFAAAAGMEAQQQQLDAIGNDIANSSTTGYKAERVGFRDLLYNQLEIAGTVAPVGTGAAAQVIGRDQSQGPVQSTGDPLDLAIEGPGYFTVKRSDGTTALTRDGSFQLSSAGQLTTAEGDLLDPPIALPKGASPSEVGIASDGTVNVKGQTIGKIALVTVAAPDKLLAAGGNLFTVTPASGATRPAAAATIHQGALEGSNVDLPTEMTQMMGAQRGYQLESSAIQTENQMLSIANQLVSNG
ncbi:MAG TPA: flagellar hook-basal body protein [Solirubrobacteraceae bacterium]|jgi:flagellar basal-body rod protein FlgG|nr:flagellar hook-basal body protein [Solirubrobacteraceae bacterium]